jgi:nucleotide-binding universal stress UspA family protein
MWRMPATRKRRSFEEGHSRKLLVIVDESPEVEAALFYCASRIVHTSGNIILLYVIEPQDFQHWMGVKQVQIEEETNKAKALFRLFRRKLNNAGFESVATEEVIREGKKDEEIVKLIEEDEDIAVLVLGAATDAKGPGPLVSTLAAGKTAGTFPIPITIVPGDLTLEEVKALA